MIENYLKSSRIECFLIRVLKPGNQVKRSLKGYYESITFYEEGISRIAPSMHKKSVARLAGYFEKAMEKVASRNPSAAPTIEMLKKRIPYVSTSDDIYYLYEVLEPLSK